MLMDEKKAAEFLGVSPASLRMARSRGLGCPAHKDKGRVRYDSRDLVAHCHIAGAGRGSAATRIYRLKAYRKGKLVGLHKRRAATLIQAVQDLAAYPSFAGCDFRQAREPAVEAEQAERIRAAFRERAPELRDALGKDVREAERVFDRMLSEALL